MGLVQNGLLQNSATFMSDINSTQEEMEKAISILQSRKIEWATISIDERITLLNKVIRDWALVMPKVVSACTKAKGADENSPVAGDEWILGPFSLMRYLRSLEHSLSDIKAHGRPRIPGPVATRPDGQVIARVFPQTMYDKIIYGGISIDIWMRPGITEKELYEKQAWAYSNESRKEQVALVLGVGNNSSMGSMDILHKLFVQGHVVIFKNHPINAYLGPIIEEGFKSLIDRGFLRIVYGDASVGTYLCNHPAIDNIHMVGSDKTFEAIVFGSGPEGQERKLKNEPLIKKPITAELGNVSPFIIVPGNWSKADIAYHAEHFVSAIINNASCNCNTPRVLLLHAGWKQRHEFMNRVREFLAKTPLRTAYYAGAQDRYKIFLDAHPEAEQFGSPVPQQLPWTLIAGVDPESENDICFTTEAFCNIFAETSIEANTVAEYLDKAVEFCNERLWGTLTANIIIHPGSLKDPDTAKAFEKAIENLKYGAVSINHLSSYAYCIGLNPWGAYPGHSFSDIQSGIGTSINALMLANTQKTVVKVPFRIKPKPAWFLTQGKKSAAMFKKLAEFDASPSIWKLTGIIVTAVKSP